MSMHGQADIWLCLSPNRIEKTSRIMGALEQGWPGSRIVTGAPPNDDKPFIVWGQIWLAEEIITKAVRTGRPFYQIDNGFFLPARGGPSGYYRFMYSRPDPVYVRDDRLVIERMMGVNDELKPKFKPHRHDGEHILIGMPGEEFGRAHGLNMLPWMQTIVERVKLATARPVRVRDRMATTHLSADLKNAWAVVTHSSNIAIDALLQGIPVFVEATSMAWPVGNHDLAKLDAPDYPSPNMIARWWGSLMCQQFSLNEMRRGLAHRFLTAIHEQGNASTETSR